MDELTIARSLLLRAARDVSGSSPLGQALLAWAEPEREWLGGGRNWRGLMAAIERPCVAGPQPQPLRQADALATALRFQPEDRALLLLCVAADRCPRIGALVRLLVDHRYDLASLLCRFAGMDVGALRRSPVVTLGLVLVHERQYPPCVEIGWTLERLLGCPGSDEDSLIGAIVGPRQQARLTMEDFTGREAETGLLSRLLRGALAARAEGINILIYGPPGTGKTELVRTLAETAGATLFSVGEASDEGQEPSRWDRVTALQLAQRMLAGRDDCVLLFDEMEDLIGDSQWGAGDWFSRREGSKIFVNRMLEGNRLPVVFTTNAVGNVDPAILRRMSYVLELGLPTRRAGQRMLDRIARDEGVAPDPGVSSLVASTPEAATVLRVAARAGRLAGEAEDTAAVAGVLSRAIRGGAPVPQEQGRVDLDLYEADQDIEALFARITAPGAPADVSLLLTGPPGTGKTGLAHRLAADLDRPLLVRRASDLLSKWVGETEAKIAASFAEAEREGAVLLFDEADSLLFDRSTASNSWEVTQVNELLTWLDRHPLPFVAATNYAGRLDPAALRRFVFKLALRPLGQARANAAFERFFGMPAPGGLAEIGNLTPGDFAVVKRQVRFAGGDAASILARLLGEAEAKPGASGRLGF